MDYTKLNKGNHLLNKTGMVTIEKVIGQKRVNIIGNPSNFKVGLNEACLKYVPLNEMLMAELGFNNDKDRSSDKINAITFYKGLFVIIYIRSTKKWELLDDTELKYVHEVQNAYKIATTDELSIETN